MKQFSTRDQNDTEINILKMAGSVTVPVIKTLQCWFFIHCTDVLGKKSGGQILLQHQIYCYK